MGRYYTKNAYSPVSRTEAIGAQRVEHETSPETDQIPQEPNYKGNEQEVRKCYKCGVMLKDKRRYIIDWIDSDLQPLCLECYH